MCLLVDVDGTPNPHESIIHILPPEIIAQIISLSIPPFSCKSYKKRENDLPPSLVICLVCRLWHQIAWSTPQLWTSLTIDLNVGESVNARITHRLRTASKWLSRSGTLPISIRILAQHNDHIKPDTWDLVHQWWSQFHPRVRDLDIRGSAECYLRLVTAQPRINLPNISGLFLKSTAAISDPLLRLDIINLNDTLVNVSLTRHYLKFITLPWHIITNLELRQFFLDETLAILSQTPNLTHFVLQSLVIGSDDHPRPERPIHLDSLETFDIVSRNGVVWDGESFFQMLRAPNLKTIRLISPNTTPISLDFAKLVLGLSDMSSITLIVGGWESRQDQLFDVWSRQPGLLVVALRGGVREQKKGRCSLSNLDVLGAYRPGSQGCKEVDYFLPAVELSGD